MIQNSKNQISLKLIIILYLCFFMFNSCGFYSMAGSIPPHIKNVTIPLIMNETAEFGLSESITDALLKTFNEQGVLNLVDETIAHSIIRGKIKKVDEGPYTYNKSESVSEYRYQISVQLEWYDLVKDKSIISSLYTGFGAYGVGGDISSDNIDNDGDGKIDGDDDDEFGDPREFSAKVAVRKISEDLINDIMTTW
ncbi:MAG: hypothetical protein CMG04_08455 [Candidatus Marinimicrobia bacterium]|nr:hypothetical protein [Candidatus Neomarinimicrobiota bacterium]